MVAKLYGKLALALLLLLGFAQFAHPQGAASLRGTVTDPSGAVIPAAKVTVTQVGTGLERTETTDSGGNYIILSLAPAQYNLTVDVQGFRQYTEKGLTLLADQSATVDVKMEVGQTTQQVTVAASAVQVDTTTGTQKGVVNQTDMVELPLNGRNAANLTFLVAGAAQAPSTGGGALQGASKEFPAQISVSTNGVQEDQVSYMLDGADYNDEFFSVNLPFPMPDALQEFSVQTSDYSAQYGNSAGGHVNIVTKSGTNSLHGDAFEFVRNAVFNARNYFAAKTDQLKRNQFGFTLGGPIDIPHVYNGKDKTFWFFGYQGTTYRDITGSNSAFVPTAAELNGDFSAYLSASNPGNALGKVEQIVNPFTGQTCTGDLLANCGGTLDKAALGLAKYLPAAPTANGQIFYLAPVNEGFKETTERVDHSFSSADRLAVRATYSNFTNAAVFNPANILTITGYSTLTETNYLAHETHIFRPNLLNEFRMTYWRLTSTRGPAPGSPSTSSLGVNIVDEAGPPNLGSLSVSGFFGPAGLPLARFARQGFTGADDVSWVRGRHNLQFGGSFERSRFDLVNDFDEDGVFSFTSGGTNLALASYMLGYMFSFTQGWGEPENIRANFLGVYAQDTFRATKRLTLTYGLRYEPSIPWGEIRNRYDYFNPANYYNSVHSKTFPNAPLGLLFHGDTGVPNGIGLNADTKCCFAPRLGFADDVFGDGKTSLRGGAGMFYDTRIAGDILNTVVGAVSPYAPFILITNPPGPFSNPYLNNTNPFPAPANPPMNALFPAPLGGGNGYVPTVDTSHKEQLTPVVYNYNLSLEHQLGEGWLLRVGYVGNHGTRIRELVNLNPATYIPGSKLTSDQRRPFQGYSGIQQSTYDDNSNYNSMQISLEKRFSQKGFWPGGTLLGSYTWSHALDDLPNVAGVEGTGLSVFPVGMAGRHTMDYGPSDFDHRNNGVISYDSPLPKLASANSVVRGFFGNWELTGILTAYSGFPFSLTAGVDESQTANSTDRAYQVGPVKGGNACGTKQPCVNYLIPASFQLPAVGTFGTTGKNSVRGPNYVDWDMGVFKNFPVREKVKLQLRGEAFNIFNRANFLNPTSTVSSGGFGTITSANDPRIIQLALKLIF